VGEAPTGEGNGAKLEEGRSGSQSHRLPTWAFPEDDFRKVLKRIEIVKMSFKS